MKTIELTGAALDWAVAQCVGLAVYFDDGVVCLKGQPFDDNQHYWLPTQNWSQGGPIIEREGITVRRYTDALWDASIGRLDYVADGPTPLIAAMRCYVASVMGDEVDVPAELEAAHENA